MFNTSEVTSIEDLLAEAKASKYPYKLDRILKAYEFAAKIHATDVRKSGDPLLTHLLTTAAYMIRLPLDTTSVEAALLHESLEHEETDLDTLDKNFGTEVAFIVEGVTNLKVTTSTFKKHNEDPSNFRNLILNATEDIRILIIRLANKLHNLQSWQYLPKDRQLNQAHKTMYVYAPLCEYLGLGNFLEIFETESFKYIEPEAFDLITKVISKSRQEQEGILNQACAELTQVFTAAGVKLYSIQSRTKNPLSLYRKIKSKYLARGEQISEPHILRVKDLLGIRVIVDSVEHCYMSLGLIHAKYSFYEDEFDDYVLRPKPSGYQSIHTVIDYNQTTIEVQIRTAAMHEFNEFGPASHIMYKQKEVKRTDMTWTKDLAEWQGLEHTNKDKFKVKAFANMIFVFTPEGKIIKLDKGASPIDFAFHVHTDIGYHYQGAMVNGKMRAMDFELKTGDIVEILTSSKPTVNWSWLDVAKSNYAKSRIRKVLKDRAI